MMTYGLLGVGFILLISFLIYRIIRFSIRLSCKGFRRIKSSMDRTNYQNRDSFPEEAFPFYQISQAEFVKIATKTAYRHPRVEDVDVTGNVVFMEFSSQTGLSRSHAKLTFSLSGTDVGKYSIETDNYDSSIPSHIANKIQLEIRNSIGIT